MLSCAESRLALRWVQYQYFVIVTMVIGEVRFDKKPERSGFVLTLFACDLITLICFLQEKETENSQ